MEARAPGRDHRGRAATRVPDRPLRRAPARVRPRGERRPAQTGPVPARRDGRPERPRAAARRVPARAGRRRAYRGRRDGPPRAPDPAERAALGRAGDHHRGPSHSGGRGRGDGGAHGRGRRDGSTQRRSPGDGLDARLRRRPLHGVDRSERVAARGPGPALSAHEPGGPGPVRAGLHLQDPRRGGRPAGARSRRASRPTVPASSNWARRRSGTGRRAATARST